ncbi:MAG: prolyl oligopeptidase family serine peptidase [Tissierellia bacterium]|nr:prolyl oligopeptidase family serine peptidase [Tissierellia bacterium]
MTNYLKSNCLIEEKVNIQGIPAIIFKPKEIKKPMPTIVFYHGWSSNKESQRLRGFILASVGYLVVIPDAIHHGERNPLSEYGMDEAKEYFYNVIFNNLGEFNTIKESMVLNHNADPERIAVMGSSMGGFTAVGIFTHNEDIKTAIIYNGCCWWENYNSGVEVEPSQKYEAQRIRVKALDPMNYLDKLTNRPILMLHGDSDSLVPVESQRIFYNKLSPIYEDKEKIKLIEYPGLNHFVTTNMMDESINWLGKYL